MPLTAETHVIDARRLLLTVGRHAPNHLVVQDEGAFASSHHAKIEYRGGVFVLTDTSLNGTYVALGDSDFFHVKLPFTPESSRQVVLGK